MHTVTYITQRSMKGNILYSSDLVIGWNSSAVTQNALKHLDG